jgi:hypothetical protein
MAANLIQGQLPFATGGGGLMANLGGTPQQNAAQLGSNYANAYNSALAMNQANYQNILGGYQQTAANQSSAQDAIGRGYGDVYNSLVGGQQGALNSYWNVNNNLQNDTRATTAGYGNLSGSVLAGINGLGSAQAQAIADQYTNLSGQQAQGLISRGLGNTTVQNSIQRGIGLDEAKAQNDLANQIAATRAGYQTQIGLQGLNFQGQAAFQNAQQQTLAAQYQGQAALNAANQRNIGLGFQAQAAANNTNLANQQLQFMNSIQAPYPNAQTYSQLLSQYGAAQQAGLDRQQAQDALKAQIAAGNRMPLPSGGGYGTGGGQGFFGPQANYGGGGFGGSEAGGMFGFGGAAPAGYSGMGMNLVGAGGGVGIGGVMEPGQDVYGSYSTSGFAGGGGGPSSGQMPLAPEELGQMAASQNPYGIRAGAGFGGGGGYTDVGGGMYLDPAGFVGMEEE